MTFAKHVLCTVSTSGLSAGDVKDERDRMLELKSLLSSQEG